MYYITITNVNKKYLLSCKLSYYNVSDVTLKTGVMVLKIQLGHDRNKYILKYIQRYIYFNKKYIFHNIIFIVVFIVVFIKCIQH